MRDRGADHRSPAQHLLSQVYRQGPSIGLIIRSYPPARARTGQAVRQRPIVKEKRVSKTSGIVIVGGGWLGPEPLSSYASPDIGSRSSSSATRRLPYDRPPLSVRRCSPTRQGLPTCCCGGGVLRRTTSRWFSVWPRSLDPAARTVAWPAGPCWTMTRWSSPPAWSPSDSVLPGPGRHRRAAVPDDAMALRERAVAAGRAVVVGARFIGCEVAASLRSLGVADARRAAAGPLAGCSVSGSGAGRRVHRAEGVDVRTGVGVAEVRGSDGRSRRSDW